MIALPSNLFYSTPIPACLWVLARDKSANGHRDRRGQTLFIDARKLGYMVDRVRREFREEDIAQIAGAYHRWRKKKPEAVYVDEPGFCKSATLEEIRKHDHVLTPDRYVGAAEIEDDDVPFEEKFAELRAQLKGQFAKGRDLEHTISAALAEMSR